MLDLGAIGNGTELELILGDILRGLILGVSWYLNMVVFFCTWFLKYNGVILLFSYKIKVFLKLC